MGRLKNYTTSVPVSRTIGQIQGALVEHGARSILADYDDDGKPTALSFVVFVGEKPGTPVSFRLPCRVESVLKVLCLEAPKRFQKPEQAARVAWRIVKDWVDMQMALVAVGQAELTEVFLPYAVTPDGGTVYQKIMSGESVPQLAPPSCKNVLEMSSAKRS